MKATGILSSAQSSSLPGASRIKKGIEDLYKDQLDRVLEGVRNGDSFTRKGTLDDIVANPFRVAKIGIPEDASYDDISMYRNEGEAGVMYGDYEWSDYIRSVAEGYFYHQNKVGKKPEANMKIDFYLKSKAADEVMALASSRCEFYGNQVLVDEFAENLEIMTMNRFLWGDAQMEATAKQFDSIISQGFGLIGFAGCCPQECTLLVVESGSPERRGLKPLGAPPA